MAIFQPTISGGGGSAPELYRALGNDGSGKLVNSTTSPFIPLPNTITDIGNYIMYAAYNNNTVVSGTVDLNNLTTISGSYACYYMLAGCPYLTGVSFNNLTTISGNYACYRLFYGDTAVLSMAFPALTTISGQYSCSQMLVSVSNLTNLDLNNLTTVSGKSACSSMCMNCVSLINAYLNNLTTISGETGCAGMFESCGLQSMIFPSLSIVNSKQALLGAFTNCTALTFLAFYALTPSSFGSNTNQFNSMLSGVTGCTVHFPMAIQSTIGSWSSVTGGFGGTNTTVLFDIVTSLTGADSNTYTRKQKESTATATAWTYNDTLYYTSGTTEPSVGDTIYSDSACTTAVTTVGSLS